MKRLIYFFALITNICLYAQQTYYPVTAGDGYGVRLWNSDHYKIHMGNSSEYHFGPVTSFSVKMNMSNHSDRGWTWGLHGATPIAGLNTLGDFKTSGYFQASKFITVNKGSSYRVAMNGMADGYMVGRSDDVVDKFLIHSNGNSYFNGGNIGIGTNNPGQKLEIYNPNLFNSNMGAESQDHISLTTGSIGNGNYFGGITWKTGSRRRAAITAVQEHTDSDYIGLAFFTKGTDGSGPMYESVRITRYGNVGIGTTTPDEKLAVNGNIHTKEVRVDLIGWSDFVFEKDYNLPTLKDVENHIKEKGHLKDIPSAKEVAEHGILLGDMNAKLLQKIEELTLYTIAQEKKLKVQEEHSIKKDLRIEALEERLQNIEKLIHLKKQ